jgi:hypothetical protein
LVRQSCGQVGGGENVAIFKPDPAREAERAGRAQARDEERVARQAAAHRAVEEDAAARRAAMFAKSPVGLARRSYERGDRVFQVRIDLPQSSDLDTTATLESILAEGWSLHSFATSFVATGYDGVPNIGTGRIEGKLVGTYVFERA